MAKAARERAQFDGQLGMAMRQGDSRAFPADRFGLTVKPGTLVMFFQPQPMPPICTVSAVEQILDPRAPAGALKVRMVFEIVVPAGSPNEALLVVGDVPIEESKPEVEVARETPPEEPAGPKLVLTDAQH